MPAPSLVVDFDPPIEWNGTSVAAIELSEPKARDMERAQSELKAGVDAQAVTRFQMALICAVSGKPKQVIEQMPLSKLYEAFNYLQGFMSSGLPTGES